MAIIPEKTGNEQPDAKVSHPLSMLVIVLHQFPENYQFLHILGTFSQG